MTENKHISPIVLFGIVLLIVSGITAALAGFGSRWEWWYFRTGFEILRWSAFGGMAAAGVSVLGLVLSLRSKTYGGAALAAFALLIALVVSGIPWSWMQKTKQVPPIHDITTDTNNPPQFVASLPLRKNAANPAEYGGPDIAAQQLKAYPDIQTLQSDLSPAAAFDKALKAARDMGWTIVDSNPSEGRIEAMDTTFWFGFKDDIVVRIAQDASGSRIDIRSVSRVGKSDVGTNAERIRSFLKRMRN
ncbi:MAG TPA: DUF1499 domain-containing protein [Nitrospirota bacterium]